MGRGRACIQGQESFVPGIISTGSPASQASCRYWVWWCKAQSHQCRCEWSCEVHNLSSPYAEARPLFMQLPSSAPLATNSKLPGQEPFHSLSLFLQLLLSKTLYRIIVRGRGVQLPIRKAICFPDPRIWKLPWGRGDRGVPPLRAPCKLPRPFWAGPGGATRWRSRSPAPQQVRAAWKVREWESRCRAGRCGGGGWRVGAGSAKSFGPSRSHRTSSGLAAAPLPPLSPSSLPETPGAARRAFWTRPPVALVSRDSGRPRPPSALNFPRGVGATGRGLFPKKGHRRSRGPRPPLLTAEPLSPCPGCPWPRPALPVPAHLARPGTAHRPRRHRRRLPALSPRAS